MGEAARPAGDELVARLAAVERRLQVLERMPSGQNTLGSRHIGMLPGARVNRSTAQTLANATFTAMAYDTERWDSDGLFDPGVATRLTCRTAGRYAVFAHLTFATNAGGARIAYITRGASQVQVAADERLPAPAGVGTSISLGTVVTLAVGDYLEVLAYQTSGGSLDVLASSTERTNEFVAQWIGRA